jgi:processive 1,2-diacylglycerol beta-glucosyltransferase
MKKDLKILLLYASYGNGHLQVSHALNESFKLQGFNQVTMIDLFAEAYPLINQWTKFFYIKSFTLFPHIYGWLYYRTKKMRHDSLWFQWFHSFGIQKLQHIMEDEKPDLIINTFPMLVIAQLKKKTGSKLPMYMVLTDFELHNRWVHTEIDKFYVASEDLKNQVIGFGIPQERIEVSGIPIKEAFLKPLLNKSLQDQHNFQSVPSCKTVLIMAGSYGVLPNLKQICERLSSREDIQVILVCGKNISLQNEMEQVFSQHPRILIFGFHENIQELMSIASLIVTKPGGITLSEAISFCLPMLLFRPVPGQEHENAKYLDEKGAALISYTAEQLIVQIQMILEEPETLNAMRHSIQELRKSNSSDRIVMDILQDIESRNKKADRRSGTYEYV